MTDAQIVGNAELEDSFVLMLQEYLAMRDQITAELNKNQFGSLTGVKHADFEDPAPDEPGPELGF
jgi:hypothetical protein